MLTNKTQNLPHQSDSNSSPKTVLDPWEIPSSGQKTNIIPEIGNLFTENVPLISAAGNPDAPRLANPKPTSEEILLEDELKLHINIDSSFKEQMEKALALVYWLKT